MTSPLHSPLTFCYFTTDITFDAVARWLAEWVGDVCVRTGGNNERFYNNIWSAQIHVETISTPAQHTTVFHAFGSIQLVQMASILAWRTFYVIRRHLEFRVRTFFFFLVADVFVVICITTVHTTCYVLWPRPCRPTFKGIMHSPLFHHSPYIQHSKRN